MTVDDRGLGLAPSLWTAAALFVSGGALSGYTPRFYQTEPWILVLEAVAVPAAIGSWLWLVARRAARIHSVAGSPPAAAGYLLLLGALAGGVLLVALPLRLAADIAAGRAGILGHSFGADQATIANVLGLYLIYAAVVAFATAAVAIAASLGAERPWLARAGALGAVMVAAVGIIYYAPIGLSLLGLWVAAVGLASALRPALAAEAGRDAVSSP